MKQNESMQIKLNIIGTAEKRPQLAAYAYDLQGKLLGHGPIEERAGKLELKRPAQGQARIFVGPATDDGRALSLSELNRIKAVEQRVMLGKKKPLLFEIPEMLFPCWIWRFCMIKGRVVVREEQPDGTVKELPLCNSRVTICEVDPWPIFIRKIPDLKLLKIRDDLLREPDFLPPELISSIKTATKPETLRTVLIDKKDPLLPKLKFWPGPFYRKDCFTTVNTDETGHFTARYIYPCRGDRPDFWFKVEQHIDGVWKTVYEPRLPRGVHWNYSCGSEVVIEVEHPAARPCYPEETVNTTETTWLHPLAVGGMYLAGTAGVVPSGTTGWVEPDGRGSYPKSWINNIGNDVTDAPFGGTLGLRMNWSNDLPNAAVAYYRFSYRKKESKDEWAHMTTPVSRHYVRTEPQGLGQPPKISYPSINIGPLSIGNEQNLYQFRPHNPPEVEDNAPVDTSHDWPVNLVRSSDLYAAYLPTAGLDHGETYEIRIEAFSKAGTKVAPADAFTFIVTTNVSGDTINTRTAETSEQKDSGFVFELYIDDRDCTAEIASPSTPHISATKCGFLQYSSGEKVNFGWLADHPGDEARWRFKITKGTDTMVKITGDAGGPATIETFPAILAMPQITLTGGDYSGSIAAGALVGKCPGGSAAFAETLYVWNKATNGWKRLGGNARDKADLEAFALTPKKITLVTKEAATTSKVSMI